jgi:hypothetical protein
MVDINRGIPVKADLIKGGFNNETELKKYDNPPDVTNIYTIKDIQLNIIGQDFIFNYIVEGDTEAFKSEYLIVRLKRTPIILTKNAANYLKCNSIYQVNGDMDYKIFFKTE